MNKHDIFLLLPSHVELFCTVKCTCILYMCCVMRKPACAKTKVQISCAVMAQLISSFVYAT